MRDAHVFRKRAKNWNVLLAATVLNIVANIKASDAAFAPTSRGTATGTGSARATFTNNCNGSPHAVLSNQRLKMTEPSESDLLLPKSPPRRPAANVRSDNHKSGLSSSLLKAQNNNVDPVEPPATSTGRKILDLAVPAAAALLIDPLMTLTDTALVGRSASSPAQLAGMGSASALLTLCFYVCNFLCTATTPLVARERAAQREYGAVAVGGQALSLAIVLGCVLTMSLWIGEQPLLRLMGTGNTGPEANSYALQFLSVRALAAPAVLTLEASTGILRGYLDTKTPVYILVAANLINLALDLVLIVWLSMGPLGAALATTTAEWISAALFLSVLAGRIPSADRLLGRLSSENLGEGSHQIRVVPMKGIPNWQELRPLIEASSSVFLRTIVLQLSLSAAAAVAARGGQGLDTGAAAAVAAHQIAIQLWILGSFFCDSLAAASQGLVADALGRNDADAVRDVARSVFAYSLVLGIILAIVLQAGQSTGLVFDIFTKNSDTKTALSSIMPLIIFAQPLNAFVFAADGVIQGASEFPFQAKAMAISGFAAVCAFFAMREGASMDTLVNVWIALITLQAMRGLTSLWKIVDRNGPINLFGMPVKSAD